MKITKTDNKFEAVIGEEPRLNDMAEVSDAQAEQEEKHEALIDFLERLDSDLPGNLYEAICDMAERIEKSAEENGGKQTDWDFARPCGKVTLVISMEGDAGDVKKIGAKAEVKRAFGLELVGSKTTLLDLWRNANGGLSPSDPDQPELNL